MGKEGDEYVVESILAVGPVRRERGADTRLPDSDPRGGSGVVQSRMWRVRVGIIQGWTWS